MERMGVKRALVSVVLTHDVISAMQERAISRACCYHYAQRLAQGSLDHSWDVAECLNHYTKMIVHTASASRWHVFLGGEKGRLTLLCAFSFSPPL